MLGGDKPPYSKTARKLSTIGLACFNFDWAVKPAAMRRISGGEFRIMGNVNTYDLLTATPEAIRGQAVEDLKAGVVIIGPGCAISPQCPNSNLQAISEAIASWARARGEGQAPR